MRYMYALPVRTCKHGVAPLPSDLFGSLTLDAWSYEIYNIGNLLHRFERSTLHDWLSNDRNRSYARTFLQKFLARTSKTNNERQKTIIYGCRHKMRRDL